MYADLYIYISLHQPAILSLFDILILISIHQREQGAEHLTILLMLKTEPRIGTDRKSATASKRPLCSYSDDVGGRH